MTAYFDEAARKLGTLLDTDYDALRKWECEVVHDCCLASRLPGFPEQLRDSLDRVVVRWAVAQAPRIAEPDFEYEWEHRARLRALCSNLHTVFHEAVRQGGISDGPIAYQNAVVSPAMDDQERLAWRQAHPKDPLVQRVAAKQKAELLEFKMDVPPELEALCARVQEVSQ